MRCHRNNQIQVLVRMGWLLMEYDGCEKKARLGLIRMMGPKRPELSLASLSGRKNCATQEGKTPVEAAGKQCKTSTLW